MNGREQVKLMIESLELRLEQVKENKEFRDMFKLLHTTCPLCKAMGVNAIDEANASKKCEKCIADASDVCSKYAEQVLLKDRTRLLRWLRYQIKKWKKIYKQIDPLRKKLEQWRID